MLRFIIFIFLIALIGCSQENFVSEEIIDAHLKKDSNNFDDKEIKPTPTQIPNPTSTPMLDPDPTSIPTDEPSPVPDEFILTDSQRKSLEMKKDELAKLLQLDKSGNFWKYWNNSMDYYNSEKSLIRALTEIYLEKSNGLSSLYEEIIINKNAGTKIDVLVADHIKDQSVNYYEFAYSGYFAGINYEILLVGEDSIISMESSKFMNSSSDDDNRLLQEITGREKPEKINLVRAGNLPSDKYKLNDNSKYNYFFIPDMNLAWPIRESITIKYERQPFTVAETNPTLTSLKKYALDLINKDRDIHGINPVIMGTDETAQKHAEDAFLHGYFGHWFKDGRKPHIVYSENNGNSYISENAAKGRSYSNQDMIKCDKGENYCEPMNVEEEILNLHNEMVYDDAHADWGHRDNILDPKHTKVNIGIAYDKYGVTWFYQHFESDHFEFIKKPVFEGNIISFSIKKNNSKYVFSSESPILISYDPPHNEMTDDEIGMLAVLCVGGGTNCEKANEKDIFIYIPPKDGFYYEDLGRGVIAEVFEETDGILNVVADLGSFANDSGYYTVQATGEIIQSDGSSQKDLLTAVSVFKEKTNSIISEKEGGESINTHQNNLLTRKDSFKNLFSNIDTESYGNYFGTDVKILNNSLQRIKLISIESKNSGIYGDYWEKDSGINIYKNIKRVDGSPAVIIDPGQEIILSSFDFIYGWVLTFETALFNDNPMPGMEGFRFKCMYDDRGLGNSGLCLTIEGSYQSSVSNDDGVKIISGYKEGENIQTYASQGIETALTISRMDEGSASTEYVRNMEAISLFQLDNIIGTVDWGDGTVMPITFLDQAVSTIYTNTSTGIIQDLPNYITSSDSINAYGIIWAKHKYEVIGVYDVVVKITTNLGYEDSITLKYIVN